MKEIIFTAIFFLSANAFAQNKPAAGELAIPDTITNKYVHSWYNFPVIAGKAVGGTQKFTFRPQKGYATVAVFLASWCIPCQVLIGNFKELEKKFSKRHTNFVFIFAHDTEADARGFVKAYKLGGYNILATVDLMKEFHQPPLPSIYVADRQGWLAMRKLSAKHEDLAELDSFLEVHTGF